MPDRIRIGQIGVGYWGPNLLRNLMAEKGCDVKSVADVSDERRGYVKLLYPSIETFEDSEEIINDPSIDAVVIATPVKTHNNLVLKSLNAKKHVLVEKPVAQTLKEVNEIKKVAAKYNLIVMAGHTFLYNPAVRYIKEYIDSGKLGDIRYIYSQRLNLGRIRDDVDALWNFAPHDVSIIQYWLNDQKPISIGINGKDYVQSGISDVVFLNVEYRNNVMANIHVSWLDPLKVRKMTIVGSEKMIVYDDISTDKIAIFDKGIDLKAELSCNMEFDKPKGSQFVHRFGDILLPRIDWKEPLQVEIKHFTECITKGTHCLTGIEHAIGVIRILSGEI